MNLKNNFQLNGVYIKNFISLSQEEKELVRNWRNNEMVRKWMYSDEIISQEEHEAFIESLENNNNNFYWLVEDEKKYLGVIYINRLDFKNKNAYLGIYTNPDTEIKGAGSQLIIFLKYIAFKIGTLHTLKLEVLDNNKKAIQFYEKQGFIEEGKLRDFVFKSGNWHDVIIMGIVDGDGNHNGV
ncbi:hypothetical protein EO92_14945 [Methanosarcina sp. 2.H.A.1B.4]|nr:hypothetical protein EO92_14945 [Methanosarcina sp. 2.H.A.1B.4]